MSLVTPLPQNTALSFYGNIGWDNSNTNIRLFDNPNQRGEYLATRLISIADKLSVIKPGERLRVVGKLNDFHQVSYMSFTNFGLTNYANNRTYYAFVTSVDYVNVNTVELTYEIDWIQTFLFDYEFKATTILREHVNDDTVGKWTESEGIELGEYIILKRDNIHEQPGIIVLVMPDTLAVTYKNGMVSCLESFALKLPDGLEWVEAIIEANNNTPERIIQLTMGTRSMSVNDKPNFFYRQLIVAPQNGFTLKNGNYYTPHNNKLKCYPYRLMTADNYQGQIIQLFWEYFLTENAEFIMEGSPLPKPCLDFFPVNYKRTKDTFGSESREYTIQYDNFPSVPYTNDTYKAWLVQYGHTASINKDAEVVNSWFGVLDSVVNLRLGSGIENVNRANALEYNFAQEVRNHALHNTQMYGSIGGSGNNFATGNVGFRVTQYGITGEKAREIDKIFDRYGYRLNVVKKPNIKGRKYVNYVMTKGAIVGGSLTNDAKVAMEAALNRGVSFWHTDDIGMELPDNPIV